MSNRLLQFLLLATAVAGTGITVAALSHGSIGVAHRRVAASTPMPSNRETATLLPTVVVRPDAEIPTLGLVTVRPDRTERTRAIHAGAEDSALRIDAGAIGSYAAGSLSSTAFDMPYYSFGKTLRRANKE